MVGGVLVVVVSCRAVFFVVVDRNFDLVRGTPDWSEKAEGGAGEALLTLAL